MKDMTEQSVQKSQERQLLGGSQTSSEHLHRLISAQLRVLTSAPEATDSKTQEVTRQTEEDTFATLEFSDLVYEQFALDAFGDGRAPLDRPSTEFSQSLSGVPPLLVDTNGYP